jgi:hypothetical protein
MKKLPAAIVALSAFAAVHAASMPSASAQRAYSWSGCYVDVNGGYGWNNGRTSYQNDPNSAVAADPIDFVPDPFLAMFGASYTYIPTPTATRGSGGLFGGGASGAASNGHSPIIGAQKRSIFGTILAMSAIL